MKNRLSSKSGLTIIEIVAAMVILVIMVAGFATVFSFAGTSVFFAGHDAVSSADGRTKAENVLATAVSAGSADTDAKIKWKGGAEKSDVSVAHVSIDVPTTRGPDGDYNLYRRPLTNIPKEDLKRRPDPKIHYILFDYNGGTRLARSNLGNLIEVAYAQNTMPHKHGYSYHEIRYTTEMPYFDGAGISYPIVRPGYSLAGWYVNETGEIINNDNSYLPIDRNMYLTAIWKCNTCNRTDCNGH